MPQLKLPYQIILNLSHATMSIGTSVNNPQDKTPQYVVGEFEFNFDDAEMTSFAEVGSFPQQRHMIKVLKGEIVPEIIHLNGWRRVFSTDDLDIHTLVTVQTQSGAVLFYEKGVDAQCDSKFYPFGVIMSRASESFDCCKDSVGTILESKQIGHLQIEKGTKIRENIIISRSIVSPYTVFSVQGEEFVMSPLPPYHFIGKAPLSTDQYMQSI